MQGETLIKIARAVFRMFGMCCLVGLLVLSGCDEGCGGTNEQTGSAVRWATEYARLTADDFYIMADGVKYLANVGAIVVKSDPGSPTYCTLELIWHEYGNEMRLFIYFKADETHWWACEIRTYDGQSPYSDWIYYTGEFFKSDLGSPFVGDINLTSDPVNDFRGSIHFQELEIQAFGLQSDLDWGIDGWDQAIELDPQNAKAYLDRGIVYAVIERREKAIADLKRHWN